MHPVYSRLYFLCSPVELVLNNKVETVVYSYRIILRKSHKVLTINIKNNINVFWFRMHYLHWANDRNKVIMLIQRDGPNYVNM